MVHGLTGGFGWNLRGLYVGRLLAPLAGVWKACATKSPCCAELHPDGVTGGGVMRRNKSEGPLSGVILL